MHILPIQHPCLYGIIVCTLPSISIIGKRLQEKEVLNTLDTREVHTFSMHTM